MRDEGLQRTQGATIRDEVRHGKEAQHYFAREPSVRSQPRVVKATLRGEVFEFLTDRGVFSFNAMDAGTRLLIETMEIAPNAVVLDLGCGYGAIGIVAARAAPQGFVVLTDVNARAAQLAQENLRRHRISNAAVVQADGLAAFRKESFDVVVCNPPLRAGNPVVHRLMKQAKDCLKPQGQLWLVAQTKQGAKTLLRDVAELLGSAHGCAIKGGYRVLRATRVVPPD